MTKKIEGEVREILRDFAKKTLNSPKLRETAAKKIGAKPSYVRAMLSQRGIGGMNSWVPLMAYCFELQGLDLSKELTRILAHPGGLRSSEAGLSPSELVFRGLDRIPIVTEDVKIHLASSLETMLKDLEKSYDAKRKPK